MKTKGDLTTLEQYLSCPGGVVNVAGLYAITARGRNGKNYVVDGHHRWSQLYFINPTCKIGVRQMHFSPVMRNPFSSLKSAQISIAANTYKVPVEEVTGTNLLTVTQSDLKKQIADGTKAFTAKLIATFKKYNPKINTFDDVFNQLWANVQKMQTKNAAITGAPKRKFMPQTEANGLTFDNFQKLLIDPEKM